MLTTNKATQLQTQILCLNTLYSHSKMIIEYEVNKLTPLIGKAIFKVDGSLKQKFEYPRFDIEKRKINAYGFDFWVNTHYYHKVTYNKYEITVITSVSGGGYDKNGVNCNHAQFQQSFDLFILDNNGVITDKATQDISFLDRVYNEDQILKDAEKVKEAAKEYETILSKVPYLFRDALYLKRIAS